MTDEQDFEEDFDPEEAERSIAEFIDAADALDGPSTQQLADDVLAAVASAQSAVDRLLDEQPTNKIIATMLVLSRRHRVEVDQDSALQWRLSAAATLVSGKIRPGEG